MPHVAHYALPEAEAEAAARVQAHLDDLARHTRTFTAAAEMLSFAAQRAPAHETQFPADTSALAKERRNMLSEWQNIAVREGAMTLLHVATAMEALLGSLASCPTLSAALDHGKLTAAAKRFRLAFPGFRAILADGEAPAAPAPAKPDRINFSQSYSLGHVQLHGAKDNVFKFGQNMKYIATAADGNDLSYALDAKSVHELRAIATTYAGAFTDALSRLSQRSSA